jgi:hypothetical protein
MIRRSTVVYITILLALAALYFYLNNREQPEVDLTPTVTEEIAYLFKAEEGIPTSIEIRSKSGEAVEIARNAENAWALLQPVEADAEQGASEAAASQLTTMRILERVPAIDEELAGLAEPEYILTARLDNETERSIHIGVVTPSETGYYVRDASGGEILIVSKSAVDGLLGLLANPPYAQTTPTPDPALSETATP